MTDNNTTTAAAKFVCIMNGKKFPSLGETQCFFATITLFLYNYYFAYLCFALLFIIVAISIFGKIKGDYRWFILNQALWDIAITYGYWQNNEIYKFWNSGTILVTYNSKTVHFLEFYNDIIETNPYTSLLLLSWSRFLALYFTNFYDRLTSKKRIFVTIIVFNLIVLFFHISAFIRELLLNTRARLNLECLKNHTFDYCKEWYESQFIHILLLQLYNIFRCIVLFKPIIFLCLSIFAAIMIITKIGKQSKFQLKHNRRDFFVSLRIAVVILFQTIINCILVFLEFTESIDDLLQDVFNIRFSKDAPCKDVIFLYSGCTDFFQFPAWLSDESVVVGLESPVIYPAVKQLRIFLESIIIIAVMTGYREAIINFFKYFYQLFRKPKSSSQNNSRLFVNRLSSGVMPNAS